MPPSPVSTGRGRGEEDGGTFGRFLLQKLCGYGVFNFPCWNYEATSSSFVTIILAFVASSRQLCVAFLSVVL